MRDKLHKLFSGLTKKRPGRRPPIFVYVGYLLVATVIFTGVTFSGYVTSTMGKDQARVAKFSVDVDNEDMHEVLISASDMLPGESRTNFIVIENASEVSVTLQVTATLKYGNLPLVLKFDGMNATNTIAETVVPANEGDREYVFTIEWPMDQNSYEYAGKADLISLVITAVQKD